MDLLRRFCSAAGYGWDYPDCEFRDIPLCYPETLCLWLLLMVISAEKFRLSPLGLVRVRQNFRTLQPIDELKKGPFMLQAGVLEYRVVEDGVERKFLLWTDEPQGFLDHLEKSEQEEVTTVNVNVPCSTVMTFLWAFSDYSPHRVLTLPGKLLGYRCPLTPSLWMLSKCLAEIEKHKGVDSIRVPISVTTQFTEPFFIPGKVTIKFWETVKRESSSKCVSFEMKQYGGKIPHIHGQICRATVDDVN